MSGPYSLVVAPAARAQASKIADWWQANRPDTPHLFANELEAAFVRVATTPASIRVYRESKGRSSADYSSPERRTTCSSR
jgi:hypothetical protein